MTLSSRAVFTWAVHYRTNLILTISKVWTSSPLRYSSSTYCVEQTVSSLAHVPQDHVDLANTYRFAFVEYESRRDADDAYHEMHNKRIGRDDLLKIEVGPDQDVCGRSQLTLCSGLVLPHRQAGASMLDVQDVAVSALHVVALAHHHHVLVAMKMIETETTIAAIGTGVIVVRETAPAARMTVTVTVTVAIATAT